MANQTFDQVPKGNGRSGESRTTGDAVDGERFAPANQMDQMQDLNESEGCYVISIAARMVGMHQQTLRYYERVGLIEPSRSRGNIRLYSPADIGRLRQIQRLINDLGVNLAGVEVIIRMNRRLQEAEAELQRLREQVEHCRNHHRGLTIDR
jgi:MerR family transcriptional regulator/heat shock protein HspR